MKKTKLIAVLITVITLFGCFICVNSSAAIKEESFIASPEKTLVKGVDYEYSFAVVGDTQCISIYDAENNTEYTEQLYNWIKNNQESKNIQYVLGLGDITNTYQSSGTYYSAEWTIAKESFAILDDANIPYSLVRGNHDISSGMNNTFGKGSDYYEDILALSNKQDTAGRPMGGFFEEYTDENKTAYKIENSFRKVTVGDDKWLIVTLDWAPSEEVLTWLSGILEANYDYRAIITLHQFVQKDGAIIDDEEGTLPHENIGDANWGEVATGGTVHPRVLWDEVLSKYANVEMILSGHVPVDDIVRTQYRGENGNTVTCMLIDPQEMDEALSAPVGMVAMFYFSADGNVVNVEYISTVRDSDGKDTTNAYRGSNNQFSMPLEYADGWVNTEYGYAPKVDYDSATFLAFLDDDGNSETESVYLGAYDRWVDDAGTGGIIPMARNQFTLGGASIRQKKTLSILTLKDYDGSSDGKYQLIGEVCGTLKVDLNNKTFKNGKYPMFAAYTRTSYTTNTFELINGDVVISGASGLFALQTTNENGNNGKININLKDLDISYGEGATASYMVTTYPGNESYNSTAKVTLTDCKIDAYTNAPSTVTLFNLADTYKNQDTVVVFKGGSITAASESAIAIYTLAEGDYFVFDSSESGYTSLKLPLDASAPSQLHKNAQGLNMSFCEASRDNSLVTYTLEEYQVPEGSLGVINVWLIGGQSNASGYAIDTPSDALTDTRFANGFEDVLYYGAADDNAVSSFVPVKIGQGKSQTASGAEIGIASAIGGNGTMNAVIKLGRGSSYLYPDTGNTVSQTYGTWTPPSYITSKGVTTEGTNIGKLYEDFVATVQTGLELLEASGYTPVIRGMWWMQGEAETWREALALEYETLLCTFIKDIRSDLSEISGDDLSNMPFVLGVVASNEAKDESGNYLYNQPTYLETVTKAQRNTADTVANVSYIETKDLERRDQWHFVADAQQYLGEEFVARVIASEGKYSVTVNGTSVSMTGGGSYEAGSSVKVVITAENGFVIRGVTYQEGLNTPVDITLEADGSYSFTMPEANVTFIVDAYDPNMIDTAYGTIPSQYSDTNAWPFAVFHNDEFYNAYATWNDVLRAGSSILTAEKNEATLLLRRHYSTSEDTESLQDLYTFEGKLTIDLGDHTLTRGTYHLFQIMAKKTSAKVRSTNIKIINGTIQTQGSTPFVINTRPDALADHFYFEFDNVTFEYASGSTASNMVMVTYTNGTVETEVTALFKNCVFDLTDAPSCTIFNLQEESGSSKSAYITIENSEFVASKLTGVSIYQAVGNDSFTFGEGVKFKLPLTYDASDITYGDTNGKNYSLKLSETSDSQNVYTLEAVTLSSEVTPYGNIPSQYTNATSYPFIVFDQNKQFIGAYEKWDVFLASGSKILTDENKKAIVLVRRSYDTSENSISSQNWYTFAGSIEIDLGGNTITIDTKSHLFQLINKCTKDTATDITISNGTIVTYKNYAPFVINGHTSSQANYTVNLICNGVNFVYHESSIVENVILDTYTTGTTESNLNAVFNDCTFDISNATKAVTLFNAKESSGTAKVAKIEINGGSIKANSFTQDTLYKIGEGDGVTFGKGKEDKYLTLTITGSAAVPTPTYYYNADGINVYFHAYETSESETVYTLIPCAESNGSHQCSCGAVAGTCRDDDNNHICDLCGVMLTECADENKDHNCDICGATLTECADANKDHMCDLCETELSKCSDENNDHFCDVCGEKTECIDENKDHLCDVCGEKTACIDANNDHKCDLCETELSKCADESKDHKCDLCGAELSKCADENKDHKCDLCGAELSKCADEIKDHKCDLCGAELSKCADENKDHKCDLCGAELSKCADVNKDHKCDLCGAELSKCADVNKDHKCDLCGAELSKCTDVNKDHKCDLCGAELSKCADESKDHKCDLCGVELSECTDSDNDNCCDECGKTIDESKNDNPDDTVNGDDSEEDEENESFFAKIIEFFKNLFEKIKNLFKFDNSDS